PSPHSDDDGARHDGVGEPAKPSHCDGAVSRYFLGSDFFTVRNAAASNSTASVPGIQQATDFFVLFRLRSEHGVDFVEQNRAIASTNLAKQIGRTDVDGLDRRRHQ